MRNLIKLIFITLVGVIISSCCNSSYETVENDPLNTRIYTLDNGLKVYLTVNKETPRLQTYIAVRVGAKNDPSETTGLAHYFEHLMFKGTEKFGTSNYELEKQLLDEIESKFEYYRTLKDSTERVKVYSQIDSLSYEASKYSIPNEYDKLMAAIGAKGTNAYTGYDMTVYTEDIPSNQIENWAKIQADRFKNNIIRGFHTELETVYEEKNMSLTEDGNKVLESLFNSLFPHHPYGTQTVLGTQEQLKNPSITNIKNYYKEWYVPNNMAICISGDFDPDNMIEIIKKYFGDMQPNNNLKKLEIVNETPINEPIIKEVYGLQAPYMALAWRFPGAASRSIDTLTLVSDILNNGKAGLIDLNVNQAQKAMAVNAFSYEQADYTTLIFMGYPKKGQTLEEVRNIILEEIDKLKKGDFSEDLIKASINNYKKKKIKSLEKNNSRADMFVDAFINNKSWADEVGKIDRISSLTKEDVISFANKHLGNNYVCVNKLEGEDKNVQKMPKPKITPILTNRDTSSAFLREIQASTVAPIEPVFVDFSKDMLSFKSNNIDILYKKNENNDLYTLSYVFDFGKESDNKIDLAIYYLDYLGTDKYTTEQLKSKLYDLALDYRVYVEDKRITLEMTGLSENMKEGTLLIEEWINNAKADENVLSNFKRDILKLREDAKLDQNSCFNNLENYVKYGPKNPATNIPSNSEIEKMTSEELINKAKEIFGYKHSVLYYGPMEKEEFVSTLNEIHKVPEELKDCSKESLYKLTTTNEDAVFIAPYDAKQIYMISYSNDGKQYDPSMQSIVNLYNGYFGSGMNSIVFQEMREARGLAYSAGAKYSTPLRKEDPYTFITFIATQNDKMMDAITAFNDIINNMPQSQKAFDIAKENIIAKMRTNRVIGNNVLWLYIDSKDLGLNEDINKSIFEQIQKLTIDDVIKFQQDNILNRKYSIGILGDEKDLDIKTIGSGKYGKINRLTLKDIFGY